MGESEGSVRDALEWLGLDDVEGKNDKIIEFISMVRENRRWGGLTGGGEGESVVARQAVDSLCFLEAPGLGPDRLVADLGTGGGFPGVVLAIVRPETRFELIEKSRRKSSFLALAVGRLGIGNATVRPCRWEELEGSHYDVVVTRASGRMTRILPAVSRVLKPGGLYVALKGTDEALREADEARAIVDQGDCGWVEVLRPGLPQAGGRVSMVIVRNKDDRGADADDRGVTRRNG